MSITEILSAIKVNKEVNRVANIITTDGCNFELLSATDNVIVVESEFTGSKLKFPISYLNCDEQEILADLRKREKLAEIKDLERKLEELKSSIET